MNPRQCYSCSWIFCSLVFLILSFFIMIFVQKSYVNFGLILENWTQLPLISIYPTQDDCKQQSDNQIRGEDSLLQYVWPGSSAGCDCIDYEMPTKFRVWVEFLPKRIIYDKKCNSTQIYYHCIDVPATKQTIFDRFPDSTGKPIKLCGTRGSQPYKSVTGTDCKADQIRCGSDDIFYCSSDSQCPITSFGFAKDAPINSQFTKLDKEVFWTSNDAKNLPIVEIRIAEGKGVCMNNKQRSITSGRDDYPLMKKEKTDCERDLRFQVIYQQREKAYYEANNQIIHVDRLSHFDVSDQYIWGIYSRQYIFWKNECRPELMEEFIHQNSLLAFIELICIMFLCIWGLILFLSFGSFCCIFLGESEWIENKTNVQAIRIFKIEFIAKYTVHLFLLIIQVGIIVTIKLIVRFMDKVVSCSDDLTNIYLIDLRDSLKHGNLTLFTLIIYLQFFTLDLIITAQYLFLLYKEKVNITTQYQPIEQDRQDQRQS